MVEMTSFYSYLILCTFLGLWEDYTPLPHPFRSGQITSTVEMTWHVCARTLKRWQGISRACDSLGSYMLRKQHDQIKGTYIIIESHVEDCFTQPTGLGVMKINLLSFYLL